MDEWSGACIVRFSKSVPLIRRDDLLLHSVSAGYGSGICISLKKKGQVRTVDVLDAIG